MSNRLPPDAFDVYVAMGPTRSYELVAEQFGVTKRAVTKCASRENWQTRLVAIESEARARGHERLVDAVDDMNQRHLKIAKAIQGKALEALRNLTLDSAMNAVRALDTGMRTERLIHGEPTDRNALEVGEIVRRECERWLVDDEDEPGDAAPAG